MDNELVIPFLNFCLNAIIVIFVLFANKEELRKLRKVLDILCNGNGSMTPTTQSNETQNKNKVEGR